jgi:hypothetical protein
MLKIISLAIGLLTIISIVPKSEAMTAITQPSLQQPDENLQSQIIFRKQGYSRHGGQYRQYDRNGQYNRNSRYDRDRQNRYRHGEYRRDRQNRRYR